MPAHTAFEFLQKRPLQDYSCSMDLHSPSISQPYWNYLQRFLELQEGNKTKWTHYSDGEKRGKKSRSAKEQIWPRPSPVTEQGRTHFSKLPRNLCSQGNGTRPWFFSWHIQGKPVVSAAVTMGIACSILAHVHFRHHWKQELSKWVEKENESNFRNTTWDVNKRPPPSYWILSQFISNTTLLIQGGIHAQAWNARMI